MVNESLNATENKCHGLLIHNTSYLYKMAEERVSQKFP